MDPVKHTTFKFQLEVDLMEWFRSYSKRTNRSMAVIIKEHLQSLKHEDECAQQRQRVAEREKDSMPLTLSQQREFTVETTMRYLDDSVFSIATEDLLELAWQHLDEQAISHPDAVETQWYLNAPENQRHLFETDLKRAIKAKRVRRDSSRLYNYVEKKSIEG